MSQILKGNMYIVTDTETLICSPIDGRLLGTVRVARYKNRYDKSEPLLYSANVYQFDGEVEVGRFDNKAAAIRYVLINSELENIVDNIMMVAVDVRSGNDELPSQP